MTDPIWKTLPGDGPLVAAAIHDGHDVRAELLPMLAIGEADRLREEDPFTAGWTAVAPTRIVGLRSRFEVDLNRPREKAVYLTPGDAWGLTVWRSPPPQEVVERSLGGYDAFYAAVHSLLTDVSNKHGRFVVLDLHSYNHRRGGPDAPPDDPADNPQVNVGTGSLDRGRWRGAIDRFITDLAAFDFPGGRLDVRENVKFRGGYFPRWIHENFPENGCALAVEFKKFFMDEWTGQPDRAAIDAVRAALESTIDGLIEEVRSS